MGSSVRRVGGEDRVPDVESITRVGMVSWSIIGVAVVAAGTVALLATISELVLPSVFAAMSSVVLHPLVRRLQARGLSAAAAASIVLVGLLAMAVTVVLVVADTVAAQASTIAGHVDDALVELEPTTEPIGLDADTLESVRASVRSISAVVGRGLVTALVGGIEATVGFLGGAVLALLIAYYLLKDGPRLRAALVEQAPEGRRAELDSFLTSSIRATRSYWSGRAVLSAIVTGAVTVAGAVLGLPLLATLAVVTFLGGFIPYLGAFVGGAFAALLALSEGGIGAALVMLAVVVLGNVLLENLLEPRILGGRLSLHPLAVLVATTTGGVVGGIVGLMLAVPVTVILRDLLVRYRRSGDGLAPLRITASGIRSRS